ncbi:MAG: GYF domain-containing protein [Planctomycetaceae bacterium]|jgi:TM2 domain-containing membrane protein YozV|nr:GYF domain-containing protein [Planctomycetaceae bacterium]
MSYYVRIKGKPFGPFDEKQLSEMMTKGRIGRTTEVSANRQEWAAAETLAFLFPPATPAASSVPALPSASSFYPTAAPLMNSSTYAVASESEDWFYSTDGTAGFGPVAQSTVVQMLQGGTLQGESLVWKQGQNAQKIRTVREFAGHFAPQLPVRQNGSSPSAQQNHTGLFCAACGNPVVQTAQICPKCGSPIRNQTFNTGVSGQKSRITYILFALVLFGAFGSHNFYAQKTTIAVIQLILGLTIIGLLVTSVWATIDAICVTKDGNGIDFV